MLSAANVTAQPENIRPIFAMAVYFRAYDAAYNMIDAEVADGIGPEAVIEKLLGNPKTEFVDARSVTRGCFTFRIRRA